MLQLVTIDSILIIDFDIEVAIGSSTSIDIAFCIDEGFDMSFTVLTFWGMTVLLLVSMSTLAQRCDDIAIDVGIRPDVDFDMCVCMCVLVCACAY